MDHAGAAADVRRLTGAPVAVHRLDRAWVETGRVAVPVGVTPWGRALAGMLAPRLRFPPVPVDLVLGDAPVPLAAYGVPGRMLFTPRHTAGSVSVLLDTGDAFVGDMAMAARFRRPGSGRR